MATKKMYKRAGKKKMTGGQANVPAQSFLEPPIAQPFAQQSQNPAEYMAKNGGVKKMKNGGEKKFLGGIFDPKEVRELRKEQRRDRRKDRKATRKA